MVGDAGAVAQHVGEEHTLLHTAGPVLETLDVAGLHVGAQVVHHLLHGLHLPGPLAVVVGEALGGFLGDGGDGLGQHVQLGLGVAGELIVLVVHPLGGDLDALGVVADALQIADGVQQQGHGPAVIHRQGLGGQLHQVGANLVLVLVQLILHLAHQLGVLLVVGGDEAQGTLDGGAGQVGHADGQLVALLQSDGRSDQQALVQQHDLGLLGLFLDGGAGQLHQQLVEGQQGQGAHHVEHRVDHGDIELVDAVVEEGHGDEDLQDKEQNEEGNGTNDVEIQMNESSPTGVLVGAHRGEHGGDGGADVLAQDDGDGGAKGHRTRGGQGLQDTHRGGGGLDDGGESRASQHAQDGVGEHQQDVGELRYVLQTGHSPGHGVHAEHESGKAQQNGADVPLAVVLEEHIQHHADDGQNGGEGGGLEQLNKEAVALNAGQRQNPGRHRGAHVGTHDDTHGLIELHHTGVDEAHHHHRGGRGGLNDGGDHQAQEEAFDGAGGEPLQDGFELVARCSLQSIAHNGHTKEEQGQAAQHRQDVE